MAVGSVLQTALSGMAAAETVAALVANNLANAQTPGYKATSPVLIAQKPQMQSPGAAPDRASGGSNPVQVGTGVAVAAVSTDFSHSSIAIDGVSTGMAIDGEGLFILEGPRGQRFYTRDGSFHLNARHELVTAEGYRVLGFAADGNLQIQTGRLSPLRIPLGRVVRAPSGESATLTGFSITSDGRIRGTWTDGQPRDLGRIRLGRFANPSGLAKQAGSCYTAGPNSGLPMESAPQERGAGTIVTNAIELSNTDVAQSLVDLQLASNLFRANLQVANTAFHLLDELMNLRRPPA
jgi:flagellar hook protein FlgE